MLSGECRWWNEFFRRGNWGVPMTRGFQDCVKRRAAASMAGRSNIKDLAEGTQYVEAVWGSCFRDTRPFDEIYR
jgi:inner membrane protease ATP23